MKGSTSETGLIHVQCRGKDCHGCHFIREFDKTSTHFLESGADYQKEVSIACVYFIY
jgi:hypothetical protein